MIDMEYGKSKWLPTKDGYYRIELPQLFYKAKLDGLVLVRIFNSI